MFFLLKPYIIFKITNSFKMFVIHTQRENDLLMNVFILFMWTWR